MRSLPSTETRFEGSKVASELGLRWLPPGADGKKSCARWSGGKNQSAAEQKTRVLREGGSGPPGATPLLSDCGNDFIRAHHFIVLVFEDVAVPHIASGETLEGHNNPRDHSRMSLYGIFPASLIRTRRFQRSQKVQLTLGLEQPRLVGLAVEDLEADQV